MRNNTGFYEMWLIVLDAEPSDFLNLPEPYAEVKIERGNKTVDSLIALEYCKRNGIKI